MVALKGWKTYAKTQFSILYCAALMFNSYIIIKDACRLTRLPRK